MTTEAPAIDAEPTAGSTALPLPPAASPGPPAPPALSAWPYVAGLAMSLALALLVAMNRLAELSGRVPTSSGRSWSFEQLAEPAWPSTLIARWLDVAAVSPIDNPLPRLATLYFALDLFFILLYVAVVWLLADRIWSNRHWLRLTVTLLAMLMGMVDLAEDLLASLWFHGVLGGSRWAGALAGVTNAKWVLAAAAVLVPFGYEGLRRLAWPPPGDQPPAARRRLSNTAFAVVQHRLTLAPVLILLVLSVLSGSQVLDQLPDAQREWITDGGRGVRHACLSMGLTLGLGALLLWLGRIRSQRTAEVNLEAPDQQPGHGPQPVLRGWLLIPIVLVGYSLVAGVESVLWPRLTAVVALCLVVYGSSRFLRRRWQQHPAERRYRQPASVDDDRLRTLYIVGDAIGISVVAVGGLSLVRTFVPMAGLGSVADVTGWTAFWAWMFCVVGLVAATLPWLVGMAVRGSTGFGEWQVRDRKDLGYGVVAAVVGGFLLFVAFLPNVAGVIFGVAGIATICLGGLAALAACAALAVGQRGTPELFRLFGFRSTPGVTLFVVAVLLAGAVAGQGTLHNVRSANVAALRPEARVTLQSAFKTWLGTGTEVNRTACRHRVPGHPNVTVRPMIMVAAEGGGIRAAYWAVAGLHRLEALTVVRSGERGCGESSTLFSGGASGGSVGLTVSKFSDDPMRDVTAMSRPDVLASVVAGTFVRDPAYGLTGVPVLDVDQEAPIRLWRDRARLMEDGWDAPASPAGPSWGEKSFLSSDGAPGPGALILNSTSTKNNCRGWLSQLKLSELPTAVGRDGAGELTCDVVNQVAPRTIDLLAAYSRTPDATAADQPDCWGDLQASTAALLTARFPYVTPSGVVGPCPQRSAGVDGGFAGYWPRTQLIDGGYIENSGLATITDLAPQWLPLVRAHNAEVLSADSGSLVVPIVVFLTNDTQSAWVDQDKGPASELAVPPVNAIQGMGALNQTRAQLERVRGTVGTTEICPELRTPAFDCATTVDRAAEFRVIVVDRAVRPEISAPLGWVLSDASIASLNAALDDQAAAESSCRAEKIDLRPYDEDCDQGFGRLSDLVRQLVAP